MTKNQIEYNKVLETRRSNLAQEDLTHKRDEAARKARLIELNESARHNLATEGIQRGSLDETRRHNQAYEGLEAKRISLESSKLGETVRHNRATESVAFGQLSETRRSNLARETETQRSNLAREVETNRAHVANETETARANQAREAETKRHNIVGEVTDAGALAERVRHDLAMEAKDMRTVVSLNPTQTVKTVNTPEPNRSPTNRGKEPVSPTTRGKPTNPAAGGGKSSPTFERKFSFDAGIFKYDSEKSSSGRKESTKIDLWPFK